MELIGSSERIRVDGIRANADVAGVHHCQQGKHFTMKNIVLAAALTLALASPALASKCPALMAKIDQAIATATVDEATKTKVMELYAKGKAEHDSGNHAASEASLGEALALLNM